MNNLIDFSYTLNVWDSALAVVSILISSIVAIVLYKLSRQLTAKDKFQHEQSITKAISELRFFQSVILADVQKYTPFHTDYSNQNYYKQGATLYTIIPQVGVQFILQPSSKDDGIPVGIVPFDWIEYVRDYDSEDTKPIVVCKFKGVKWYKNFKSPFKEIGCEYKNENFQEGVDPEFMRYTPIKPKRLHE